MSFLSRIFIKLIIYFLLRYSYAYNENEILLHITRIITEDMQWIPYLKQCKTQLTLPDLGRKKLNTQSIIILFILATFWERQQFTKFKTQFGNMLTDHASTAASCDFNKLFLFDVVENLLNEKDAAIGYNIAKLGFVFIRKLGLRSPALVADIHRHYIRMEHVFYVDGTERLYLDLFNSLKENRIGDPYGLILCTCDILTQADLSSLFFDKRVGIADYLLELSKKNEIDNIFASRLPPNIISDLLLLSRSEIMLVKTAIQTCKTPFLVHYLSGIDQHSKLEDTSRIFLFNSSYLDSWKNLSLLFNAAFSNICREKNCNHCTSFVNHIVSYLWCPDEYKIEKVLRAMRESSDLCDAMELQKGSKSFQQDSRLVNKIFETIGQMKSSIVRHEVNQAAQDYWDAPFLLQFIFDKIALALLPENSTIDSTTFLTTYFALTKQKQGDDVIDIKNIVDLILVSRSMKILVDLFSTPPTSDFTLPPCSTIVRAAKSIEELKDKQLSQSVKDHIQFSNSNYKRLQNLLKNIGDNISSFSLNTLKVYSKYENNIFSLMRCCNVAKPFPFTSMVKDVENFFDKYSTRKRLVDWLAKHNCNGIDPIDEIECESYDELEAAVEEFDGRDIFKNDIDFYKLLILTEENSIVFVSQINKTKEVSVAYKNTLDFYKNVIGKLGDTNFKEIIHHRDIFSAIHQNIENESQIIRRIVGYGNHAANVIDILQKITEYIESNDILGSINDTFCQSWKEDMKKIGKIQSKIKQVKLNLSSNDNNKIKQEFPQNSFESWSEVDAFLNEKLKQINTKLNEKQNIELQQVVQTYEMELKDIYYQIQKLQSRKKEIEENLLPKAKQSQFSVEESFKQMEHNQKVLKEMCFDASAFCKNENEMNKELFKLFKQKKFEEFDCFEISKCLWKMDLTKYQSIFELNQIGGAVVSAVEDSGLWKQLGIEKRDCFYISFNFEVMKAPGYLKTFSPDYFHDCCVCSHNTRVGTDTGPGSRKVHICCNHTVQQ